MISFFRLFQKKILSAALLFFLWSILVPSFALAQAGAPTCPPADPDAPQGSTRQSIEVKVFLPGVTKQCTDAGGNKVYYVENLQRFVGAMYRLLVGLAGILAVFMMMAAGYYWLFAAGNTSMVQKAKDLIYSSFFGLFLAASSYIILLFINPALVQLPGLDFKEPNVSKISNSVSRICAPSEEDNVIKTKSPTFGCGSLYFPNLGANGGCTNLTGSERQNCLDAQFENGCMGTRCAGFFDDSVCYITEEESGGEHVLTKGTCLDRGFKLQSREFPNLFGTVSDLAGVPHCGLLGDSFTAGTSTNITNLGADCDADQGWCILVDGDTEDDVAGFFSNISGVNQVLTMECSYKLGASR